MANSSMSQYLQVVDNPATLKTLRVEQLADLAAEIRRELITVLAVNGGHLAPNLGVVELSLALHYVFNTPEDKLVWDVGHQAYPHKVLTGRRDVFHTIRQLGGISGFLRRSESVYDTFGAGHASTAISAALGMATARDFDGKNFKVIAVVGDGSMTGGMAYEAMNNAGILKKDMIIVLNDNHMVSLSSVQPNIWSLHNYFNEMLTHPTYNKFKASVWDLTGKLDTFGDRLRSVAQKVENNLARGEAESTQLDRSIPQHCAHSGTSAGEIAAAFDSERLLGKFRVRIAAGGRDGSGRPVKDPSIFSPVPARFGKGGRRSLPLRNAGNRIQLRAEPLDDPVDMRPPARLEIKPCSRRSCRAWMRPGCKFNSARPI